MDYGAISRFRRFAVEPLRVSPVPASIGANPYRPHDPAKHERLVSLARSGATHKQIAAIYGGTPHGVRANPMRILERHAVETGSRLSGMAYSVANDLNFVKRHARATLQPKETS